MEKHRSIVCELVSLTSFYLNSGVAGHLEAVIGNDGGALLFLSAEPLLVSRIKDPGKTQSVAGNYFLWQTWKNSMDVSYSRTMCLLRHRTASTLLSAVVSRGHVLVYAHACRHLLLAPWVAFLKSLMPQECKSKLFTTAIAVHRCFLPVNTILLPCITAVLYRSSKAGCKVLQLSQIMYGARRENVQACTEQCDSCVLRLRLGHAYMGKMNHLPEGSAGSRL